MSIKEITAIAHLPQSQYIVVGYTDGSLRLWSTDNSSSVDFESCPKGAITDIKRPFDLEGNCCDIIVSSKDDKLTFFTVKNRSTVPTPVISNFINTERFCATITFNSTSVFGGCDDGNILIYSMERNQEGPKSVLSKNKGES
eukprot:UN23947